MTAKMEARQSVNEHIEKMRGTVSQMAGIGSKVPNDDYKLTLLRTMPSSYESIVVVLENIIDSLKI